MVINYQEKLHPQDYKLGWQLDLSYSMPRLVFRKITSTSDSLCAVYYKFEIKEHLERKCLTNLEYLEGLELFENVKFSNLRETAALAIIPRDIFVGYDKGDK